MEFKKDKTGKLDKLVAHIVKNDRPDLECLNFLCVWREKEKFLDGQLVMAEVSKLSPKHRDVFEYDILLEVDINAWKELSKSEKKKLIFHELQHIKLDYGLDKEEEEKEDKSSQEIFEELLEEKEVIGEPKTDKAGRVCIKLVPHNIQIKRFSEELLKYGLSPEEEAIRQYLNYVKKNVGFTE